MFYLLFLYGTQRLATAIGETSSGQAPVTLLSPFVATATDYADTLCLRPSDETDLLERSVALQLSSFFPGLRSDTLVRKEPYVPFEPDVVYDLDEYKRFPTLKETFREFMPTVSTMMLDGRERISVFIRQEGVFSRGRSLVLLDGVAVTDHALLLDYNPYAVKRIAVYEKRYAFGPQIYEGILALHSRDGNLSSFTLPANSLLTDFQGLVPSRTGSLFPSAGTPDFRHTLYWNPEVTDRDTLLHCTTSDWQGSYTVTVRGIGASGEQLQAACRFTVE